MGEQVCDRRLTGSESWFFLMSLGEMQGALWCFGVETCNRSDKGRNMKTEL